MVSSLVPSMRLLARCLVALLFALASVACDDSSWLCPGVECPVADPPPSPWFPVAAPAPADAGPCGSVR